jgi:hypothetical protein
VGCPARGSSVDWRREGVMWVGEEGLAAHKDPCRVLQPCNSSGFTVLAELRKCGLTDSETCLKSVTLNLGGGQTVSAAGGMEPQ